VARYETTKDINLTQLCVELGRVPLRCVVGEFVEAEDVDDQTLAAAVEGHVADPDYVDPDPPEPPHRPLDANGVAATLNAVLGVWSLTDAANAVQLPEQELIDEATAWAELAAAIE
jgi:hypothetical protein